MSNSPVTKPDPTQLALDRATPQGEPLSEEEKSRIEASRRELGVAHSEVLRQLEERQRKGE
jgi:hypothetical protein